LGARGRRVQFSSALIEKKKTSVTRKRKLESTKCREITYQYHLEVNGQRIKVCKKCFLSTLDETNRFVSEVLENKNAYLSGVTRRDKRGKHTPALKIAQVKLDEVINQINRFPAYESHYTRRENDKKYLLSH